MSEKRYTISIPDRTFWKIYVPITLVILMASMVGGILFIDSVVMPHIVGLDRGMVIVPNITGMSLEQGREKLFNVGLLTEINVREYDSNLPIDGIISHVPAAGEKVKKGRRILVVVSKGEEYAVVPDVENLTERQAHNEFKKYGFSIGEVQRTWDDKHARDLVIKTYPLNRTTISRDMKVDLILSKGPKPTSAEMPNIVGETLAEATKKVEESGLRIGKKLYKNNHSLLPGTVISQSVPPGDNVPLESSVTITVSIIR
jgi:beta-lactam-binding protein with PASTA domain